MITKDNLSKLMTGSCQSTYFLRRIKKNQDLQKEQGILKYFKYCTAYSTCHYTSECDVYYDFSYLDFYICRGNSQQSFLHSALGWGFQLQQNSPSLLTHCWSSRSSASLTIGCFLHTHWESTKSSQAHSSYAYKSVWKRFFPFSSPGD